LLQTLSQLEPAQAAGAGIEKRDHAINLKLPAFSVHGQLATHTTSSGTRAGAMTSVSKRSFCQCMQSYDSQLLDLCADGPSEVTASLGGHQITFETGTVARLADGSVTVRQGGTVVLVTAVGSQEIDEAADGVPLQVCVVFHQL
jgi:hypothetical protein